jgi:hypothetical protein
MSDTRDPYATAAVRSTPTAVDQESYARRLAEGWTLDVGSVPVRWGKAGEVSEVAIPAHVEIHHGHMSVDDYLADGWRPEPHSGCAGGANLWVIDRPEGAALGARVTWPMPSEHVDELALRGVDGFADDPIMRIEGPASGPGVSGLGGFGPATPQAWMRTAADVLDAADRRNDPIHRAADATIARQLRRHADELDQAVEAELGTRWPAWRRPLWALARPVLRTVENVGIGASEWAGSILDRNR